MIVLRLANGQPPTDPNQPPANGDWVQDGPVQHEWHEPETPTTPPPATTGDGGWFWLRLFTPAERRRWNALLDHALTFTVAQRLADPWIAGVIDAHRDLEKARTIDLSEAAVIAGVTSILRHTFTIDTLDLTVLETDERRDEVLAGKVVG